MTRKGPWNNHSTVFAALILVVILIIAGFALYPVGEFGLDDKAQEPNSF
jgi:hypothetical protein